MIFYSRENGRDGEKDYIDTNDLKDVYFEADAFNYIEAGRDKNDKIVFKLKFNEEREVMYLNGEVTVGGSKISVDHDIQDPVALVEQGAIAYYSEKMLDEVDIIKEGKDAISGAIKAQLLDRGIILKGTSIDAMGLIENNGNTIAVIDNVTIHGANSIVAESNYSITSIQSINAGILTVYLTENKVLRGTIEKIEDRHNGAISIISQNGFELIDETSEAYVKSKEFANKEEYTENRAQYIQIDTNVEVDFDEFDELF